MYITTSIYGHSRIRTIAWTLSGGIGVEICVRGATFTVGGGIAEVGTGIRVKAVIGIEVAGVVGVRVRIRLLLTFGLRG